MPRSGPPSTLAALLALLAVLCAGLAPDGYMPGRTASGGWGLVLCPDGGPAPLQAARLEAGHASAPHGDAPGARPSVSAHGESEHAHHLAASEEAHESSPADDLPDPVAPAHDGGPICPWATGAAEAGAADPGARSFGDPVLRAFSPDPPHPRSPGPAGLAAPPPPSRAPPSIA